MGSATKLYCSFSAKPGKFGATLFTKLFSHYGIDAVYLPRKSTDAKALASAIRTLGVAGCAISMPLKEAICNELDEASPLVKATGSCNTILNKEGHLIGHNTDVIGVMEAIKEYDLSSVLLYGAGGVVPSVVHALRAFGIREIALTARRPEAARERAQQLSINTEYSRPSLLINCTPASQGPLSPELTQLVTQSQAVFDLVISPKATVLEEYCKSQSKVFIPGWRMGLAQLREQFFLYEKIQVEPEELEAWVRELYLEA